MISRTLVRSAAADQAARSLAGVVLPRSVRAGLLTDDGSGGRAAGVPHRAAARSGAGLRRWRHPPHAWAVLVLGCGLMALMAQAPRPAVPASTSLRPPDRFTVSSDGHPIAVWARRPATPKGSVLFVHGRTWSGRPDFDLQVPGLQRSVLQSFSTLGYAAYAIDLRGYGATPRDSTGWLTPRRSAMDIANVLAWMAAEHPGLPKPTLVGWSRGAAMAGMVAIMNPERLSHLVLFGFAFDPDLSFADVPGPAKPEMLKNTASAAASDFISPRVTPREVVAAFVDQALKADPILVDVRRDDEFNGFKPAQVTVPTLILFGSDDPGVSVEDAGKMFAALRTGDKQMVVLPGSDHAAHLEDTHEAWVAAIVNFIQRPGPKR